MRTVTDGSGTHKGQEEHPNLLDGKEDSGVLKGDLCVGVSWTKESPSSNNSKNVSSLWPVPLIYCMITV